MCNCNTQLGSQSLYHARKFFPVHALYPLQLLSRRIRRLGLAWISGLDFQTVGIQGEIVGFCLSISGGEDFSSIRLT